MSTGAVGEQYRVGAVEVDRGTEIANRFLEPPFFEGDVALSFQCVSHVGLGRAPGKQKFWV